MMCWRFCLWSACCSALVAREVHAFRIIVRRHQEAAAFCHGKRSHQFLSRLLSSESDGDAIFFDDFGDAVIGNSGGKPEGVDHKLLERFQEVKQEEIRKDSKLSRNWRNGNWRVRGFILDNSDALIENATSPILVSSISKDTSSSNSVVVGRTDGSVCCVRLGTECITKFVSKLSAKEDQDVIKVSSQLVRYDDQEDREAEAIPFEITHQFSAHDSPVSVLFMEDDMIFTAAEGSPEVMAWNKGHKVAPHCKLSDAHSGSIVALKSLSMDSDTEDPKLLLSAASDGSFALWDIANGDLVFRCLIMDGQFPVALASADTASNLIFLGLSTGEIVGYVADEIIRSASAGDACPLPSCRFAAHESTQVTAICCSGNGTLERGRPGVKSSMLLTGGGDGSVKQWEIFSRPQSDSSTKLEHWPRLANQRMQKRAHTFKGHAGSVTALAAIDPSKFLSAATDGTVRAWNPTDGQEIFAMDGFSNSVTSLCLNQDVLITNGMDSFVCVHDFDVEDHELEDGELEC